MAIESTLTSRNNTRAKVKDIGRREFGNEERRITEFGDSYEILINKKENDEADRRKRYLTDSIKGKKIMTCILCGEYQERDSTCPLINSAEGLCAKSFLRIEYEDKINKYKLSQFGIK